ncbi:MAG: 16S rRNA (cytosine(967)-C(5))-methyltransferase RsmB [Vicinamibacterales bacterium]|nr:16S rRNA (cytosine(967)-C(5))-methyltransferase RsmB [Vicinamibacterales bacterium]
MIAPARTAAFRALLSVEAGQIDLGEATARARAALGDARDRALLSEIVTGTLRARGAIDFQLARTAGRPLAKLDPEVLIALRMGLYQLLYLERVPASAVVNDAVALVRKAGKSSAAGFVNGILRRLARERATLPWPARPDDGDAPASRADAVAYLSISGSHPVWLVERWLDRHGFTATEAWVRFNNTPSPLCLRVNTAQATREAVAASLAALGIRTRPARWAPHGLIVEDDQPAMPVPTGTSPYFIQDEASQLVPELLQAGGAARVLDACAAPGGKAVAIASGLGPGGMVVAADVRPRRVALVAATLRAAGVPARVVHTAADGGWPWLPRFTHVLVDAPCSGLGTVRRDPDIRWRRQPDDLDRFAAVQDRLLIQAARAVMPGGRIVYSTCSSEPEENDAVVDRFLLSHPGFRRLRVQDLPGLPAEVAALADPAGYLRTDPARHGLEAFFGAVFTAPD